MSDSDHQTSGGDRFVKALLRVGYSKPGLKGSDFDWMFETELGLHPFLDWFCDTVKEENVVTSEELNAFEQLKLSGNIHPCESVESALQNLPEDDELEADYEYINNDVHMLEKQLQNMQDYTKTLTHQRNILRNYLQELIDDTESAESVAIQEELLYFQEIDAAKFWSKQVQCDFSRLTITIGNISAQIEENQQSKQSLSVTPLLSHMDLHAYKLVEDAYSKELCNYVMKQVSNPLTNISARENFRVNMANPHQPSSVFRQQAQAQCQDFIDQYSKEIARLHSTLQRTEKQKMDARIQEAAARARVKWLEECCLTDFLKDFSSNLNILRSMMQQKRKNVDLAWQELEETMHAKLPDVAKDIAQQRWGAIMNRNADLKLARQEYFLEKQEKVIGLLLEQQARKKFVNFALDLEDECQHDMNRIVQYLLESLEKEWKAFIEHKNLPSIKHGMENQSSKQVIDFTVDKTASDLYTILSGYSGLQSQNIHLYTTYDHLYMKGRDCQKELSRLVSKEATISDALQRQFCTSVQKWKTTHPCCWQAGLQFLSSVFKDTAVSMNMTNAQIILIEKHIIDATKEFEGKRRKLQQQPLRIKERALMTMFYSDAEKFKKEIKATVTCSEREQLLQI